MTIKQKAEWEKAIEPKTEVEPYDFTEKVIFKLQDIFQPYGRFTYEIVNLLVKTWIGTIVMEKFPGILTPGMVVFWIFYPLMRDILHLQSKTYKVVNGKKRRIWI